MSLDLSKLVNLKSTPTGWVAQCPECARNGRDLRGKNHLSILRDGRYHCAVGSAEIPGHNRNIRALVRGEGDLVDAVYIDPEPRLSVDKVYSEDALRTLLPDYSYWIGRGMKETVLARLENGIAPKSERGKLAGRTVFPIRDLKGRIMGFSGRLIEENSFAPTWKHLFRSGKAVYPHHISGAAIKRMRTAVLQESLGDIAATLSHDIEPVLCTWGLNLSDSIIAYLVGTNVRRVICAPNRDKDPRKGQAAAERWRDKLENFFPEVSIRLPNEPFSDWGECAEGGEAGAAELARFRTEVYDL